MTFMWRSTGTRRGISEATFEVYRHKGFNPDTGIWQFWESGAERGRRPVCGNLHTFHINDLADIR